MPQTKGQGVVFGILMSVFMAYGMELYNVAAKVGGMENKVFWLALKEAAFMCVFVFVFSTLFGNRVGRSLAFRHVTPGQDNPFFITIMISSCTWWQRSSSLGWMDSLSPTGSTPSGGTSPWRCCGSCSPRGLRPDGVFGRFLKSSWQLRPQHSTERSQKTPSSSSLDGVCCIPIMGCLLCPFCCHGWRRGKGRWRRCTGRR